MTGALVRPTMAKAGSGRPASAARILPTPSSSEINPGLPPAPNGVGRIVSSIVAAATPTVASSSTVRATFKALP